MQRLITQASHKGLKYFDIAANLADDMFKGHYYGKPAHDCDLDQVLSRATQNGVDRLLIVGGHIQDTLDSFEICKRNPSMYKTTVGVHPCRANEVFKAGKTEVEYYERMDKLITEFGTAVTAIGECGLDYDRLEYSDKETQLKVFPMHFDLAAKHGLPMYLHSRNCPTDFLKLVKQNRSKFSTGCVHSYTGEEAELREILEMGLYVGINGCSLKTPENIEIAKKVPLDRLMIESKFQSNHS